MRNLILAVGLIVFAAAGWGQVGARVGVFDERSLVLAYYRSSVSNQLVKAKVEELKVAKAAGDAAKVAALEKWGAERQELAHRQLAGEAPITNILEYLKPLLPDVAQAAGVDVIPGSTLYLGTRVEKVDITDLLVARFNPDAKTLEMIEKMRRKP